MLNLDIENTTNSPIYIARGWPYITITGSYLNAPPNYPAIYALGLDGYYIGANLLETIGPNSSPAVVLAGAQIGVIGTNTINTNFASPTSVQCDQYCTDLSFLVVGPQIVYRCTASGTLPVGALTADPANCGTAVDTGLRMN